MAGQNYGWNDTIESDGAERSFTLLPEGEYNFTVVDMEKAFSNGDKYAGAPMAKLTLNVDGGELGTAEVRENIILNADFDWKISGFFRAIGAKKRGEKLMMDWGSVTGKEGRAQFRQDEKTSKKGTKYKINAVDSFVDYDPKNHMKKVKDDDDLPF